MKGIVLAGGSGTRLLPLTNGVSKQLLPVYDKPAIYYPISVLMLAGIREIMIISSPRDLPLIKNLMGDGKNLGVQFSYCVQQEPKGIAQAFTLCESFIGSDPVCLILGDNFFFGSAMQNFLAEASLTKSGAHVFAHTVTDPKSFGVLEFGENWKPLKIVEKPENPRSNWVLTGLYFYDNEVVKHTKALKPSARGELEITDINQIYLKQGSLKVTRMGRGIAWLDAGTPDSLLDASQFVQAIEKRQGFKIACLEEIALFKKFITHDQFTKIANGYGKCGYGDYLRGLLNQLHSQL